MVSRSWAIHLHTIPYAFVVPRTLMKFYLISRLHESHNISTLGMLSMWEMLRISFSSLSCCWCCKPIDRFSWEFLISCGSICVGGFSLDGSNSGCIFDVVFLVGVLLFGDVFVFRVTFALKRQGVIKVFCQIFEITYASMTFIKSWWYFWYSSSPNSAGSWRAASKQSQNWWISFWHKPVGLK